VIVQVFPFVLLFGSDELSTLETVMTMLMWWGYSWNATFPHPPMHIVDTFDAILQHNDIRLHHHLRHLKLMPGVISMKFICVFNCFFDIPNTAAHNKK